MADHGREEAESALARMREALERITRWLPYNINLPAEDHSLEQAQYEIGANDMLATLAGFAREALALSEPKAEGEGEGETCRKCGRHVPSPCHDLAGFREGGPWDYACRDIFYPSEVLPVEEAPAHPPTMEATPMSDIPALEALLARVEGAEGPDRRLDFDICLALGVVKYNTTPEGKYWFYLDGDAFLGGCSSLGDGRFGGRQGWEITASVDAVLGLVERELPGWWGSVDIGDWGDNPYTARLNYQENTAKANGEGATPALALLAAFLRAKDGTAK